MGRTEEAFQGPAGQSHKGLMPFICAGYPRPGLLKELFQALEIAGASICEVGIPFSDPIADGPVIAQAMHQALEQGATPAKVFEEVKAARPHTSLALIAMVSVSIVHRMGGADPRAFCRLAADAGFDGLIIPDVPVEESGPYKDAADAAGLSFTLLIAPTTSRERAERIVKASSGFVYLLARTGTTGENAANAQTIDLAARTAALRDMTSLPIACGFGISTPEHAAAVARHADGVIVGSALVRRMGEAVTRGQDPVLVIQDFVGELARALRP
ncbi:MAG: tryptophan synthase subunit alpha [Phycisphaerales bacterium]